MRQSDFTRLLHRAALIAEKHAKVQGLLTEAFNHRYGCTYSDVDADELIDYLDYGAGGFYTARDVDAIMKAAKERRGR